MGALKVYTENGWEQVQTGGTSAEIPTALPNPHKLTFSGAAGAEYDGSEPVEVVIPEGGGGVYVGSGEMPEGYNIQIDPDGSVVTEKWVFTLADGRSIVKEVVTV